MGNLEFIEKDKIYTMKVEYLRGLPKVYYHVKGDKVIEKAEALINDACLGLNNVSTIHYEEECTL